MVLPVLRAAAVRVVALSVLVVLHDVGYGLLVPPTEDADVGRGLLAFLLVFAVAGLWGVADGARGRLLPALATWALATAVGGLSWWVGFAVVQVDATVTAADNLRDPSFLWFTLWLVGLPALAGVLVGRGLARLTRSGASAPAESARMRTT